MTNATTENTTAVEKAEQALAEARSTLEERLAARQIATTRVDVIESAWTRGDDSISAAEKIEAEAEVSRMETLIPAAERAVKIAERKLKSLTPVLAEKVADALNDSIFGTPAEVATAAPVKGSDTPKVYVVEVGERRYAGQSIHNQGDFSVSGGAITGDVEIIVTGPDYMAPFDSLDVVTHLRSRGVITGGHGVLRGPSVQERVKGVFAATFRIDSTLPLMPIISAVSESSVRHLEGFDQSFKRQTYSHYLDAETAAGSSRAEFINETVDDDGIRRANVDVSLFIRPINGARMEAIQRQAEEFMAASFSKHKGIKYVGTIEKANVTTEAHIFDVARPAGDNLAIAGLKVTAHLTFVSKAAE